jgi:hypothetical protein
MYFHAQVGVTVNNPLVMEALLVTPTMAVVSQASEE